MSALADAIGTIPDNALQLAYHLAGYITDPSAIRAHVKRETGRDIAIERIRRFQEEATKKPIFYRRTLARPHYQSGFCDESEGAKCVRRDRLASDKLAAALLQYGAK